MKVCVFIRNIGDIQDLLVLFFYRIASKMDYAWSGLDDLVVQQLGVNLGFQKVVRHLSSLLGLLHKALQEDG